MTYERVDQQITVTFTVSEYCELLAFLGFILIESFGTRISVQCGDFIKRMNRTNPDFEMFAKRAFGKDENDEKTAGSDGSNREEF